MAFWEDFVSRFVVLYLTHSCELLELRSSETASVKQWPASADF